MEPCVEYPDRALSASPKHGVVFRIPDTESPSRPDTADSEGPRRYFRPQSAKSPSLDVPSRVLPTKTKAIRPWSAHARIKDSTGIQTRKLARQTLKKPHFRAPPRSPATSVCSETSSLVTAVGLETRKHLETSTQDSAKHAHFDVRTLLAKVGEVTPPPDDTHHKWAITIADTLHEDVEPVKPESTKRSLKKHPSVETWIAGSPHDSDEYDTDLDIEDYVKSINEEKPIDPTGKAMYEEQCERQGIIPVSYMKRHLGDKNLRMRHHYLGGSGTKPVALALRFNTITENLDLSDNFVEGEGAVHIASMLKENTFITSLNISRNFIGREGVSALSNMLETNTALKTLNLSGNQLTDACAQCLIEGLKNNSSLTSLDLSNNDFGEQGGICLGGALGLNEGLIDLDLSWNAIRNRGATALIGSLSKNNSLEVLDLSWNGLGQAGAEALKQALKINTSIRVLDLTNNRFNAKAAESLAWGVSKNFGLDTLVLNLNPMKDAGMEAILKAVENHPNMCLLSLELSNLSIPPPAYVMQLNSGLLRLDATTHVMWNYDHRKGLYMTMYMSLAMRKPVFGVSVQEVSISAVNYHKIEELQNQKDITILYGGKGGYNRPTTATSMVKLFMKFVRTHHTELEIAFNQYDMERSGWLGIEDLKAAFKEAGLRLTSRQLDMVLEEINFDSSTAMNYKNILNGQTLAQYLRQRPSRIVPAQSSGLSMKTLQDSMQRQLTVA